MSLEIENGRLKIDPRIRVADTVEDFQKFHSEIDPSHSYPYTAFSEETTIGILYHHPISDKQRQDVEEFAKEYGSWDFYAESTLQKIDHPLIIDEVYSVIKKAFFYATGENLLYSPALKINPPSDMDKHKDLIPTLTYAFTFGGTICTNRDGVEYQIPIGYMLQIYPGLIHRAPELPLAAKEKPRVVFIVR